MKNFYLAVVIAILLPLSILAKPIGSLNAVNSSNYKSIDYSTYTIAESEIFDVKVGDFPAPQMAFNVFVQTSEYFWTTIYDGVTPLTYEPKSGTLIYIATSRETVQDTAISHIDLYFSKDAGATWTTERVYTRKESILFFPSISVLNPNNETDPRKFRYVITTTPFLPEESSTGGKIFRGKGSFFIFFYGEVEQGTPWTNEEHFDENFPTLNNDGLLQQWGLTSQNMLASSSPKGHHVYIYGMLSPINDGIQYGAYGLQRIDCTNDGDAVPSSGIPQEWALDKFAPSPQFTSTMNAPMRMGADPEGNVYAFFFNTFADNTANRLLSFSKSTDNGRTWSALTKMPVSIINDYVLPRGHNVSLNYLENPFGTWDVVVTGVDEFHAYQKLAIREGADLATADATGHFVEMSYKAGSWLPIKKVGDFPMNKNFTSYYIFSLKFNDENPIPPVASLFEEINVNPRRHEIQAALTADGTGIVVKYLSFPEDLNIGALITPVTLHNSTVMIDSLNIPDIYIATRRVDGSQWNVLNATQDLWYNKGTYIPNIVPSFEKIPIVETITRKITNPINFRVSYPYFMQNMVGDRGRIGDSEGNTSVIYSVANSIFNAVNPVPINNPTLQVPEGLVGVVSVHEQLPFAIQSISPNPANEVAQLNFSLEINADVRIDIRNSMGQTLKTLNITNAQVGENTISVVTNDLSAGAYFYTITVNGKTQTKLLNVVR